MSDPNLERILAGGAALVEQRDRLRNEAKALRSALDLPEDLAHAETVLEIYRMKQRFREVTAQRVEMLKAAGLPMQVPHSVAVYELATDLRHRDAIRNLLDEWRKEVLVDLDDTPNYNAGRRDAMIVLIQALDTALHDEVFES